MQFTCAILTVSDKCFNKTATDNTGPALAKAIKTNFPEALTVSCTIVPNNQDKIIASLKTLCKYGINLILTTGGTGLSKRDVTPEATKLVINKEIPGITQTMLLQSLQVTDMVMLSRGVAGIKDNSLIINLPGSSEGALECFEFIKSIIPHSIDLILERNEDIENAKLKIQEVSEKIVKCDHKIVHSEIKLIVVILYFVICICFISYVQ